MTSHATLRLLFQFELPVPLDSINDEIVNLNEETYLFGSNQFAEEALIGLEIIIEQLLAFNQNENQLINYSQDFDCETVNMKIIEYVDIGIRCPVPKVVILEAGGNPSKDEEIFAVCNKFIEDLDLNNNESVEVFCDEAIFRRVMKLHEKNSHIRPLLGQWHTSKNMCSVLLTLFSSYGIYNLAAILGVRFLDKLEAVVDYRSIKIWFRFYKWGCWWKLHRAGIRTGNAAAQLRSLAAFAPLFPAAGKLNYTKSTVQFLALLEEYPRTKELLRYAGSVNLSRDGHYYAFDEALEVFGVKFIKENVTGNVINEENLKNQIKGSQTERERIDLLLSEFTSDRVMAGGRHSIDQRKEALWTLINTLVEAFESSRSVENRSN